MFDETELKINKEENYLIDSDAAHNYIENLFDYKTDNQLLDLLKKEFGETTDIDMYNGLKLCFK